MKERWKADTLHPLYVTKRQVHKTHHIHFISFAPATTRSESTCDDDNTASFTRVINNDVISYEHLEFTRLINMSREGCISLQLFISQPYVHSYACECSETDIQFGYSWGIESCSPSTGVCATGSFSSDCWLIAFVDLEQLCSTGYVQYTYKHTLLLI